jgi:hypothetical protein
MMSHLRLSIDADTIHSRKSVSRYYLILFRYPHGLLHNYLNACFRFLTLSTLSLVAFGICIRRFLQVDSIEQLTHQVLSGGILANDRGSVSTRSFSRRLNYVRDRRVGNLTLVRST